MKSVTYVSGTKCTYVSGPLTAIHPRVGVSWTLASLLLQGIALIAARYRDESRVLGGPLAGDRFGFLIEALAGQNAGHHTQK